MSLSSSASAASNAFASSASTALTAAPSSSSALGPSSSSSSSLSVSTVPSPSSSHSSVVTSIHVPVFPFPFYERFVLSHHSWFLSFIDTLRSLTLFLPGRFSSSELRLEAFYCFLNFLSYYHEKILERPVTAVKYEMKIESEMKFYEMLMQKQEKKEEQSISLSHTVHTAADGKSSSSSSTSLSPAAVFALNFQFLQKKVKNIERCKSLLSLISYCEVLFELCCNQLGEWFPGVFSGYSDAQRFRIKFLLLFLLEAGKGALKMYLLRENGGKMLVAYSEQEIIRLWLLRQFKKRLEAKEYEAKNATADEKKHKDRLIHNIEAHLGDTFSVYALHGRYASPHGKFIFPPSVTAPPPTLTLSSAASARAANDERLAELLYIFRPAAYCFLRFLFDPSDEDSSWIPWVTSLFMDLSWRGLYGNIAARPIEQQSELKRRMAFFAMYAARAPFFQAFIKSPLEKVSEWSTNVPLLGFVFNNVITILLMLQRHYFYTAAS